MVAQIDQCLDGAVKAQHISRDQAQDLSRKYHLAHDKYAKQMNMTDAQRKAAAELAQEIEQLAQRKDQLRKLHVVMQSDIMDKAAAHSKGQTAGFLSFLVKDIWGEARHTNVSARKTAVTAKAHQMFSDGLIDFKPTRLGTKMNTVGLEDLLRDLYAQMKPGSAAPGSGNPSAARAATAWAETSEYLRNRFNQAGGDIKKRRNWHVPQRHNSELIRRAAKQDWVQFVNKLKIDIVSPETGHRPGNPIEQLEALNAIYETLATEGQEQFIRGGMLNAGKKLANKRGDPRTLQFLDAESWISYNRRFGEADIYGMLTNHIEGMATDIARMEVLGPNPDAVVKHAVAMAKNAEKRQKILEAERDFDPNRPQKSKPRRFLDWGVDLWKGNNPAQLARRMAERPDLIEDVYDVITGKINIPKSMRVARIFGGIRNVISTAQLGGASVSAVTDLKFLQQVSAWNGLEMTKVMRFQSKLLNPKNPGYREHAVRLGLAAEAWTQRALGAARHQDEIIGNGWTAKLSNSFHWATGLTPLTQANRWAFGFEFSGKLAQHTGQTFDALPAPLKRAMRNYGIEAKDWDAARAFKPIDIDGADFMNAADMSSSADPATAKAGRKIQEMILTETDFAVPTPDERVRAITSQGTSRGTLGGEFLRSTMMYKSFGITVLATHGMRAATAKNANIWGREFTGLSAKAMYLTDLLVGLTFMGGIVINTKQVLYGRDPRDMTELSFLGAAFMQGGGMGILGDFVVAATGRNDDDLYGTLLGPMYALGKDTFRLTSGNVRQAIDGRDSNFTSELVRFASRYTPGANLWYSRAATDHLIFNQLRAMADPQHNRHFKKSEKYFKDNYGQGLYWKPGKAMPDRMPDLSAVFGGSNDD